MNNANNVREMAVADRDAGLSPQQSADVPMSATRMAYMADLLAELQDMASVEGHTTLAGILALARAEALAKSR